MPETAYAIGQAVFFRTDMADYVEVVIPFQSLEEMVKVCSQPRPDCVLEKVIIYASPDGEPTAVSLGFISSTRGQRPDSLAELSEGQ